MVVALMNDFAYVLQAIAPNLVWKQTDCESLAFDFAASSNQADLLLPIIDPKSTIGLNYSFILSVALCESSALCLEPSHTVSHR